MYKAQTVNSITCTGNKYLSKFPFFRFLIKKPSEIQTFPGFSSAIFKFQVFQVFRLSGNPRFSNCFRCQKLQIYSANGITIANISNYLPQSEAAVQKENIT